MKRQNRFSRMSSSKVDQFTSNQDQNDLQQFYKYRRIHFISENASFLWYLSVVIREVRMSQRPPGRAPFYAFCGYTTC